MQHHNLINLLRAKLTRTYPKAAANLENWGKDTFVGYIPIWYMKAKKNELLLSFENYKGLATIKTIFPAQKFL